MINLSTITAGIETILNANLSGYTIERNPRRNVDPNLAAKGKGWIGIYRGMLSYMPHTTGATPWLATIAARVEIQVASMRSGEDAEDKLQEAETEVMEVLADNLTLNGTVNMTMGYEITYETNEDEQVFYHAALITIKAEVRTG